MNPKDFEFELPESLIAKYPANPRDSSRLLVIDRRKQAFQHSSFSQITQFLNSDDILVLNNTKVFPARLYAENPLGKKVEVLLLREASPLTWTCLIKPGRKIGNAEELWTFPEEIQATIDRTPEGFYVAFKNIAQEDFHPWLERVGEVPLPHYLNRPAEKDDTENYQTIFAKNRGSVAAPTAGLHFTPSVMGSLREKGVTLAEITLHVGYGTFARLSADNFSTKSLHPEYYSVDPNVYAAILETKKKKGRVIATGTTSLRALESIPLHGLNSDTRIFIKPGDKLTLVDGLITNFHLPNTSLFVLVSTLLGLEFAHTCYQEAIKKGYRFYSYGDAMLIL